jgi:aspartate aminotransferase
MTLAPSATLAIDERVRARLAAGERIIHLGFGEAGLPVPEFVREQLARAASANAYGPVAGSLDVRGSARRRDRHGPAAGAAARARTDRLPARS